MNKRWLYIIVGLLMIVCIPCVRVDAAETTWSYDADAAIKYAEENFDNGIGVCDEFVKDCLAAGGVKVRAGGVEEVVNALVDAGYGVQYEMQLDADNYHLNAADNSAVKAGDPLIIYCEKCNKYQHFAFLGGTDEEGNFYAYGHNPAWDKVDWFGNFKHTLPDGNRHADCYKYYAICMDRTVKSHAHTFEEDLYEEAHPHKLYDRCSCGTKYYLGWNATVLSCTKCNPPVGSKPVVSATVREDGAIIVTWSTVEDVVHYEVYRAKKEEGPYFKISTTDWISITNTSVEEGVAYYYYVKAVRANEADSVESDKIRVPEEAKVVLKEPVVTLTNTAEGVQVKWNKVAGAEGYAVCRRVSGASQYTKIKTISSASTVTYLDKTAKSGTKYEYTVRATSGSNQSTYTGKQVVYLKKTDVTVTNASTGIQVKWNKITGAKGYAVYRRVAGASKYTKIKTISSGSTVSYLDKTAKSGIKYDYAVRATNGSYQSAYTGKLIWRLSNPSVTLTTNSSSLQVKWNKVTGAMGYIVYRKTGSGSYAKLKTISSAKTVTYTDKSVKNGNKYTYKIVAVKDGYTSSYTAKATVFVTAPKISSAKNSSSKAISVKWGKNTKATGYQIQYVTGSSKKTVTISKNSTISYTIKKLAKSKTYKIYVRSYKTSSGTKYYSAWSAYKSVKVTK